MNSRKEANRHNKKILINALCVLLSLVLFINILPLNKVFAGESYEQNETAVTEAVNNSLNENTDDIENEVKNNEYENIDIPISIDSVNESGVVNSASEDSNKIAIENNVVFENNENLSEIDESKKTEYQDELSDSIIYGGDDKTDGAGSFENATDAIESNPSGLLTDAASAEEENGLSVNESVVSPDYIIGNDDMDDELHGLDLEIEFDSDFEEEVVVELFAMADDNFEPFNFDDEFAPNEHGVSVDPVMYNPKNNNELTIYFKFEKDHVISIFIKDSKRKSSVPYVLIKYTRATIKQI